MTRPQDVSSWWQALAPITSFIVGVGVLWHETTMPGSERVSFLVFSAVAMGLAPAMLMDKWLRR